MPDAGCCVEKGARAGEDRQGTSQSLNCLLFSCVMQGKAERDNHKDQSLRWRSRGLAGGQMKQTARGTSFRAVAAASRFCAMRTRSVGAGIHSQEAALCASSWQRAPDS
jgi:hypothetical protein